MDNRNSMDGWERAPRRQQPSVASPQDDTGWERAPARRAEPMAAPTATAAMPSATAAPAAPRPQPMAQRQEPPVRPSFMPGVQAGPQEPSYGAITPRQAVDIARPTVEMLSSYGAGRLGTTVPGGLLTKLGMGVLATGLGYGVGTEALRGAEAVTEPRPERRPPVAGAPEAFMRGAESVLTGSAYDVLGRALSPVAGAIAGAGRSTLGAVRQAFSPEQRAASIAREAAGNVPEARRLLQGAQPGELPGQALARVQPGEQLPSQFPTLQNLLDRVLTKRDPEYLARLLGEQDFRRLQTLEQLAGGANQTAARQAREEAQRLINEKLIPQLNIEMEAANLAGRMAPRLEAEAARMGEAAASRVEDVRRFTGAAERARASREFPVSGMPRVSSQITYRDDLARRADKVAEQAAEGSLRFGEAARFSQAARDSLEAYGLRPLTADTIQSAIARRLADPRIAAGNRDLENVLGRVSEDIEKWTRANGVVDAWALDSIRKHAINSYVNTLPLNPKQSRELASSMVQQIRPILIDAVEEAGGTGYRSYLQAYAQEMRAVNEMKLLAKAREMYTKSPEDFMRLVRGDNEKVVEKIFGPGEYSIAEQISPRAMNALQNIASQVGTGKEMARQVAFGAERAEDIYSTSVPTLTAPNLLNRPVAMLNAAMRRLGSRLERKTVERLTEAAKTAGSLDDLLATIPAREAAKIRNEIGRQMRQTTQPVAGSLLLGLQAEPTPVLSGQARVGERNAAR
jgi:hypothetical protein